MKAHNGLKQEADRVRAWPYAACYILFPLVVADYYHVLPCAPFFTVLFVFGIIPALDFVVGLDDWNPSKEVARELDRRMSFRLVTYAWVPLHLATLLWACVTVSTSIHTMDSQTYWGLVLGVGIVGGLGINCSHELVHRMNRWERSLGVFILLLTMYPHWYVEHIWGHHKTVATASDPASAYKNESSYGFVIRSVVGGLRSAFAIDWVTCSLLWALTVACALLVDVVFPQSLAFFVSQAMVAILLLELINYIEHYGLRRREDEPVTPFHSWNAGHRVTNYFLIKLQRHSDHHAFAGRRYQVLRSWKEAPQLPTGYAGMVLCSLCPPLFCWIMNSRVEKAALRSKKSDMSTTLVDVYQ
jgi:alkane 1-monooxygenase